MHQFRLIAALILMTTVFALTGCHKDQVTADKVRKNMSPELYSVAATKGQFKNQIARSVDTTSRQIHDDWAWLWLMDQPLHLSKYPIP